MMLLAKIKPSDEDFKGYRIAVTDFAKTFGLNTNKVYEDMERVTRSLRCREVGIRNGKSFFYTGWLSSVEYKHGSGYVELCFDPKLKPYLLQLKGHFTQYELDTVLHFKSIYAIRLYELLKKEAQIVEKYQKKNNFEKYFSYEFLRDCFGIDTKQYKKFNDFKRFSIEPAVTEINEKTELNIFEVVYSKTGRKVSDIKFVVLIRSKDETGARAVQLPLLEVPKEKPDIHPITQALLDQGFVLEVAQGLLKKYGVKRIERNLAYMLAENKNKPITNKTAYLNKAIADDYGNVLETQEKKKQAQEAKKLAEEQAKRKVKQADIKKRKEEKERAEKIITAYKAFPSGMKRVIKEGFAETLKDNAIFFSQWQKLKDEEELLLNETFIQKLLVNYLIESNFI